MNRDELLILFEKKRYCVLWPGNWKDVGFTEIITRSKVIRCVVKLVEAYY